MDRFGIFVDAGYLYAASGELCFGVTDRNRLSLSFGSCAEALADFSSHKSGLQHLRTYWYDGARDARPTPDHLEIAHLPGVKLRLGRLVRGRQKGVDSRIVRDLIVLSQERAISVAYLMGGDEDLREGVSEAQERGVRVVLIAIEPLNEQNLSPTLAMEADEVVVLGKDFISPHIRLIPEAADLVDAGAAPVAADPLRLGRELAAAWKARVPADQVTELRRNRPRIPPELDRELLDSAASSLGHRHIDDDDRKKIRRGFWQGMLADLEPAPE